MNICLGRHVRRSGANWVLPAIVAPLLTISADCFAARNVTISKDPTSRGALSDGVFTPTGNNAVLNIHELRSALAVSSVTVTTGTDGSQNGDITVAAKLKWPANTLTLDAYHAIAVDAKLTALATAGLALKTNDGGSGGDVVFGRGKATFQDTTQALEINGTAYTLVADISTLAADISGAPGGSYALIGDYDASNGLAFSHSPIPTAFSGIFEGLGNRIANLTITDTTHENVAFFLTLSAGGVIRDLELTNVNVSNSTSSYIGGLVVLNLGLLRNDFVSGQVAGSGGYAGGLAADNEGGLENSRSTAAVSSATAGGLVAINKGAISGSSASGTIGSVGGGTIGGLVGWNSTEGSILASFATGDVNGTGRSGGLVGLNYGGIDESYAIGNVTGGDSFDVGGLIARNTGTIRNDYAKGSVSGGTNANVGGFVGYAENPADIRYCYSTGAPAGGTGAVVGGFIGFDSGSKIVDAYWNTTTSGIADLAQGAGNLTNDPGITGLSSGQLRSGLPAGFDAKIWAEQAGINGGFPFLLDLPPS